MTFNSELRPDIIYESNQWLEIKNIENYIAEVITTTSKHLELDKYIDYVDFSIVLADDTMIQKLNKDYRNIDKATNVLSFPIEDIDYNHMDELKTLNKSSIGDIITSYDTLLRETVEQNKQFEQHFKHLLIHSILHLFGYDHEEEEEAEIMEALEVRILKELKICSPYE